MKPTSSHLSLTGYYGLYVVPPDSYVSPSVQFSHSVVSDSFWLHGPQLTRLPCPSSTPRACSNSYPSSWWCHPTISSSVVPFFSFCLRSFPASESFLMSQFFVSGGQSIGASASSISPSNEYSGPNSFRIDCFDLLAIQGTLKSLLQHHSSKSINSSALSFLYICEYMWIPNMMVFGDGTFGRLLGSDEVMGVTASWWD